LAGTPAGAAEHASNGSLVRNLTLAESILLAVRNNQDLASGRLDRLAQKLSLEDAEDGLRPVPALDLFANRNLTATPLGRYPYSGRRRPSCHSLAVTNRTVRQNRNNARNPRTDPSK